MSQDEHLRADHYVLTRDGGMSRAGLALRLHQHLVQVCGECRIQWEQVADDQQALRELLVQAARREPAEYAAVPLAHRPAFSRPARQLEEEVRRLRAVRSQACRNGWELLREEPEERGRRLDVAWQRYRSRSEAEYVLEKAREVIRDDPREAARRAALARRIAERIEPEAPHPWLTALAARATAWEANALRVAGDLPAADRRFARLRRELATADFRDARALAEITSLEASLRIDQRRIQEAHALLDLAALVYRAEGDETGEVKVLIKQGNLFAEQGDPAQALDHFHRAAQRLAKLQDSEPYLLFCVVTGQVVSLCEMGRFDQADHLLDEQLDVFEDAEDLHAGALLRHLRGRVARGMGCFDPAIRLLRDAQEAYLAAGRTYDATLAALDLAEVLAATERHAELGRLATGLFQLFQSQEVPREAIASLKLLARAAEARSASKAMVEALRERFVAADPPPSTW